MRNILIAVLLGIAGCNDTSSPSEVEVTELPQKKLLTLKEKREESEEKFTAQLDSFISSRDVSLLYCPPVKVTKADKCGSAPELTRSNQEHCGFGHFVGETVGEQSFIIFGREISQTENSEYLRVTIHTEKDSDVSKRGDIWTHQAELSSQDMSTYQLWDRLEWDELDRSSLVLTEYAHVSVETTMHPITYPFDVWYHYRAMSQCEIKDFGRDRLAEEVHALSVDIWVSGNEERLEKQRQKRLREEWVEEQKRLKKEEARLNNKV